MPARELKACTGGDIVFPDTPGPAGAGRGGPFLLFNSLSFALFLPVVVAGYHAVPARWRWALLLAASYYFYMCWKAEYLLLILASTLVDYVAGLALGRERRVGMRRFWLGFSLATNLGLLFAFKYWNFFSEATRAALAPLNLLQDLPAFDLLLPVGISFYTFQTLSYTIDLYRGKREPERHPGYFALYVAFFPQLVAGPIERSDRLLPQLRQAHAFSMADAADGCRLMLWGFFKKLVIADRLAVYVNEVFNHPETHGGLPVWVAAWFFAIQIYCDFSGYSDVAIGSAQLLGIRLMDNFRQPYFATSIADFWHRWHISLSTWFRDYVYLPLGGNKRGVARWHVNILVVFLVSGLWHGANWTFVVWGGMHGVFYLVGRWTNGFRDSVARMTGLDRLPRLRHALKLLVTFHLVALAFVVFRAASIGDAWTLGKALLTPGDGVWRPALTPSDFMVGVLAVVVLVAVDARLARQNTGTGRSPLADAPAWPRRAFYYALAMAILVFGKTGANPFIYFQF
jgi:alginate O-acetyltransferase complex protein AlgI